MRCDTTTRLPVMFSHLIKILRKWHSQQQDGYYLLNKTGQDFFWKTEDETLRNAYSTVITVTALPTIELDVWKRVKSGSPVANLDIWREISQTFLLQISTYEKSKVRLSFCKFGCMEESKARLFFCKFKCMEESKAMFSGCKCEQIHNQRTTQFSAWHTSLCLIRCTLQNYNNEKANTWIILAEMSKHVYTSSQI